MAVQQQKENYQRILDKTIEQLEKKEKCQAFCCIAAVHHAATMCWNIFLNILRSQYCTTTPIFLQKRSMKPE